MSILHTVNSARSSTEGGDSIYSKDDFEHGPRMPKSSGYGGDFEDSFNSSVEFKRRKSAKDLKLDAVTQWVKQPSSKQMYEEEKVEGDFDNRRFSFESRQNGNEGYLANEYPVHSKPAKQNVDIFGQEVEMGEEIA